MALISSSSTSVTQPLEVPVSSGGVRTTTMGPASPTGAWWMCAPVAGSTMSDTAMAKHTSRWPWFRLIVAVPDPSGSPGPGTSLAPWSVVVKGRPPVARAAELTMANDRADEQTMSATRLSMPLPLLSGAPAFDPGYPHSDKKVVRRFTERFLRSAGLNHGAAKEIH